MNGSTFDRLKIGDKRVAVALVAFAVALTLLFGGNFGAGGTRVGVEQANAASVQFLCGNVADKVRARVCFFLNKKETKKLRSVAVNAEVGSLFVCGALNGLPGIGPYLSAGCGWLLRRNFSNLKRCVNQAVRRSTGIGYAMFFLPSPSWDECWVR